ncbi:MAG: DNA translocase FtsK [Anaerolineae bacterium]|nr:DNA translocase FtsK [Anaerolineae bacterium]MDQ7035694.1 DNA translocase FtsK [Anaerolineae bacterium]
MSEKVVKTVAQSSSAEKPSNKQRKKLKGVDNLIAKKAGDPVLSLESKRESESEDSLESTEIDDLPKLEGAIEPTFWDDVRDSLPDWLDEILAIGLLIFGILSFLALFDTSGAAVAVAWAAILRQLFGIGSFVAVSGLSLIGIVILLPKFGIRILMNPSRILAVEISFLCVLALIHLTSGQNELRAIARAGEGGGFIGWGLVAIPEWLLGRSISLFIFGMALIINLTVVAGLRRRQIVHWLNSKGESLLIFSETTSGAANRVSLPKAPPAPDKIIEISTRGTPIMRIVPKLDNLPPSLRRAILAGEMDADEEDIDLSDHPLFQSKGDKLKLDFNLIGEVLDKRSKDGFRLVRRPDGREKRYFSVDEMKEDTKTGRRSDYLPDLSKLKREEMRLPDENEINHNVVLIENTLLEFDVDVDVVEVQVGPTVTRYALQPYRQKADGSTERTRLGKIASYHSDLSLALSAKRLRLEIPVPGTNYMGIEVPNKNPSVVTLRSVFESKYFYEIASKSPSPLTVPLGRDVSGRPVAIDIGKMPHLLIAGTTGSGKSVAIAAIASAILLNNHPDKVQMVMLDPKMVELSRFNGLPHLIGPVETDNERIIGVLKWCTREMDRRYKLLEESAVRNIENYNEKFGSRRRGADYMPYIVILVDEIGDLMMSQPEETERAVTRLAQMARAVGMHLVIATQRPSVDVITGLIKANFPGRIAFSVASGVDSRVILDSVGAEHLMGQGDMLYQAPDAGAPKRIQGCFVSDEEVRDIVQHWKDWQERQIELGRREYIHAGPWMRGLTRREFLAETDPMLEEAIEYVVDTQEASASLIQRELGLGYPRAARIMDMLEEMGVVGDSVGGGRARRVLIERGEDPFKRIIDKIMREKLRQHKKDSGHWNS